MADTLRGLEILAAGGCGGLGSATVGILAAEGARVVSSYRSNRERAAALADVATLVEADITAPDGRARLLDACPKLYGLAVFAGDPARVTADSPLEDALERSHRVNYLGPILLAREAAARMRAAGAAGSIVLVSTMQAVSLFVNSTAYAGAKAALLHAARILAKECRGPSGIRVNVICPGVNAAGMAASSIAAGKYDRYLADGVIPRFGSPLDVARAVRFFLEPDNYITGQVLTVDGGLTL